MNQARGHCLRRAAAKIGLTVSKAKDSEYWRVRSKDGKPVFAADIARVEAFIREQGELLAA